MLHYILQTILFQLLFLLMYEFLLKKETFFTYNRLYLLITPILSLVLPLLKFQTLGDIVPPETLVLLPEVTLGDTASATSNSGSLAIAQQDTQQINWLWIAYFTGLALSFLLFLRKYRILRALFNNKVVQVAEGLKIIEVPNSNLACTFFNTIFLGDKLKNDEVHQILSHELIHVKQRHSVDLLFFEALKILFWFNPLVYIYQSRLSTLHEFIADAGVVKTVEKKTYYQQLLNTAFSTENISFINQFFNHSLIKKRIVMLQKSRSKTISKFKYLFLVPLMLAMLTYVACSDDPIQQDIEENSLSQYTYTMGKDGEMSASTKARHDQYEDFLKNNPDHVGWASINRETNEITYTVHPKAEPVPEGYHELKLKSPDGESYTFFMNINGSKPQAGTTEEVDVEMSTNAGDPGDVPFAVIDEVPVFPGCGELASNAERKACMSEKITQHINQNFNTGAVKAYAQAGKVNRIFVQFRIGKDGSIEVLGARAPHPELSKEAERVVRLLPQMAPGKQGGKEVAVLYSIPISFKVSE